MCIAAFTLEFIARMLAAPATVGIGKFWSNPMNWIDLLAIMPSCLLKIAPQPGTTLRQPGLLRLSIPAPGCA